MASALVSIALEKLTSVLEQQLSLFQSATGELQRLRNTLQSIQAVLADTESRQVADRSVHLWLGRLRKVAYDIEDLLDEWLIAGLKNDASDDHEGDDDGSDGDAGDKVAAAVCLASPYACFHQTLSHYKLSYKLKEIRERIDQIAKDKDQFSSSQISSFHVYPRPVRRSRTMTSSYMQEEMIGRDDDKDSIVSRLVSTSSGDDGQLQVIAIVGMGGQGKTTLARRIYNDRRVQDHFKQFMWVCVSEDFDVKRLTKAIIEEAEATSTSLTELNSLQNQLLKALSGKHFLLVLDDVWNEDKNKWNSLQPCLTSGARGSRILVTTRLHKVATNVMNAAQIHELKGLSDDHSWRLFSGIAFDGWDAEQCSQLESVGREIVKKCKGVPLSIKVMGSTMNSKRTRADWQNILESTMWSLPEAENKILPALWLSYYNLPSHLKQCFIYCSIYEKDTEMYKDELVRLWITQGFIQLQGNREIEDIGEGYFDDLVACSMFQEVEERYTGVITCKIHDLLHDVAGFITKDETHIYTSENPNPCPTDVRHVSLILSTNNSSNPFASHGGKTLRTLFLRNVDKVDKTLANIFHQARFLRALLFPKCQIKRLPKPVYKLQHLRFLDLSNSWIVELPSGMGKMQQLKFLNLSNSKLVELPNAIGKLKHLRHLDLSYAKMVQLPNTIGKLKQLRFLDLRHSDIAELPESVIHLHNLHTLNLDSCVNLKNLPRGIGRMVNLRRLKIDGTWELDCLPSGLGRISCLQTLRKFIVGGERGCGIDELQLLNSLEGDIEIKHLERVPSREEARKSALWNKPHLHRLVLEFKRDQESMMFEKDTEIERMDSVLEGLRPHENLEELKLDCNRCNLKLPSWIEDASLSKLNKLEIQGFIQYCDLSGLGRLSRLIYLDIRDVGTKKVGYEFYYGKDRNNSFASGRRREVAFAKLEQLSFHDMLELEEWELTLEADAEVMPSLRYLQLENCPKLKKLPIGFSKTLTELIIWNCYIIEGTERSCFPLLEKFTLIDSSGFFSHGLPDLPNLKEFEISGLRNEMLPDEGWERLLALQELAIDHCHEFKFLPDGLAKLQSLTNLSVESCSKLESLFEGLGQLKKLESLRLWGSEALTCLPDSLGQLDSLEYLCILDLKRLQSLPEEMGQLKKLKSLVIGGAQVLISLPDSLALLESLEYLDMSGLLNLRSLPEGLGQLKKLKSLTIREVEALTRLPNSLGQLESLKNLGMGDLKRLELLPEELGQLNKLKKLTISGAEMLTHLPDSIGLLESLERFQIIGWEKLESLPHSLGQLKKLESLTIQNMEALGSLPDSLGQIELLRDLHISLCPKLKLLPVALRQLKRLLMEHLEALTPLPSVLGQLKSLETLILRNLKEFEWLSPWLGQLKELKQLTISDCTALRSLLPHELHRLPLLQTLVITNCPLLLERCMLEGGKHWYKILNVPEIYIDGVRIQ